MKLKTLQDLQRFEDLKHSDHFIVSSSVLKKEAIKHIKHHKGYCSKIRDAIAQEFMDFFNIKESDLK